MSDVPADERRNRSPGRDRLSVTRPILLKILSIEIAVLVVTGIALWLSYRQQHGKAGVT